MQNALMPAMITRQNETKSDVYFMNRLLLIALAVLLQFCVTSSSNAATQRWEWQPPNSGSDVVYYVVQLQVEGSDWETIEEVDDCRTKVRHPLGNSRIRVAGVDANGMQGPWSEPSIWFIHKPARPGKPKSGGPKFKIIQ